MGLDDHLDRRGYVVFCILKVAPRIGVDVPMRLAVMVDGRARFVGDVSHGISSCLFFLIYILTFLDTIMGRCFHTSSHIL